MLRRRSRQRAFLLFPSCFSLSANRHLRFVSTPVLYILSKRKANSYSSVPRAELIRQRYATVGLLQSSLFRSSALTIEKMERKPSRDDKRLTFDTSSRYRALKLNRKQLCHESLPLKYCTGNGTPFANYSHVRATTMFAVKQRYELRTVLEQQR